MEETIIIYTKYFSEAVIEVLDTYDLNVQIMCFSSYDKVLEYTRTTPNLRGIIFLEYRPRRSFFKAYQTILTVADEIAESTKQPLCVSIISNTDLPNRFLTKILTSNLEILFTKFVMFNTDLLRFEGLAAVIVNTIGVANETILLELEKEDGVLKSNAVSSKTEFLKYCLQITTVDENQLTNFEEVVQRFPELEKLIQLRTSSHNDDLILEQSKNLFKVFAEQCIKRREQDGKKVSGIY